MAILPRTGLGYVAAMILIVATPSLHGDVVTSTTSPVEIVNAGFEE